MHYAVDQSLIELTMMSQLQTQTLFLMVLITWCCAGYVSIMAADQSSDKEVLEAESPGLASDLNRSDLDPIYIGGLPASRPIR